MSELPTSPQLHMLRPHLLDLPAFALPEGYGVRTFLPGDGAHWERIIAESFNADPASLSFETTMRHAPAFRPERIFFITCGDEPVATASAYYHPEFMPDAGMVHYVGVLNGHAGKRLGYMAVLATLEQMAREGRRRAWLSTDDFRLPAIKTYLNLGFEPLLIHENQRERWPAVFAKLGLPELAERFVHILTGPVWERSKGAPDDYDYDARVMTRRRWLPHRPSGRPGNYDIDALGDESLYHPSELGVAGAGIGEVSAGEDRPFALWLRVGSTGIPAGARVEFYTPGQRPLGTPIQTDDSGKPGYLRLDGPPHATLAPFRLGFTVTDGCLRDGDEVRLTVGEGGGFTWTPLAGRKEFKVIVDIGHGEPVQRLPEPVVIRVLPREVERLEVLLPATGRTGDPLTATVTARDRFDNRVPCTGPVEVTAGGGSFTGCLADGSGRVALGETGAEPARAEARWGALRGASNWCQPADGLQLYFGDLHAHDITCPAEGYSDAVYRWARDDKRLDFLSVPVQAHAYLDNEKWLLAKYHAEAFLDEGRFVTFLATEWQHSHYGDKVIHFLGNDAPPLPVDDPRYAHPARLYEALRGTDAFIISHHPGYALDLHVPGTDWDAVETDVDRLVELWSMHGSSEGYDPADRPLVPPRREEGVMEALRQGLRLGFVAGSDTHSARPGGSAKEPRPYWGGLCAVWAERLTRRALFDAFRARRTYALTGARIILRFTVNGAPMGAEILPAPAYALNAEVLAPAPVAKVQFLRDGEVLHEASPGAEACRIAFTDTAVGPRCYHCRVTQRDGHLAVSSPVWLVPAPSA